MHVCACWLRVEARTCANVGMLECVRSHTHGRTIAPTRQLETLTSERERLLLRARAAQIVLQAAEAVANVVTALRERGQGEPLKGLAGSQMLAQLQAQLQGLKQELCQLEGSAGDAGSSGGSGDGAKLLPFARWLPPPPPLCWTIEQALAAAEAQPFKGYVSLAHAYAPQMASVLR